MAFYTVKTSEIVHDYIQAQIQGIKHQSNQIGQQCDNSVLSDWVHIFLKPGSHYMSFRPIYARTKIGEKILLGYLDRFRCSAQIIW